MINVSEEYKEQINNDVRNRGHIRVTVGIINRDAQKNAIAYEDTLYSGVSAKANMAFEGNIEPKLYAMDEQDFAKVDGSMYFMYGDGTTYEQKYFNGMVARDLVDTPQTPSLDDFTTIRVDLQNNLYTVKGLTINFGDSYPTRLTIETNNETYTYENDSPLFIAEDTYEGVNYFIIKALQMVGGEQRLRIVAFNCGVVDVFTEEKVMDCNTTDFSSPISESVPSRDMTIKVDNIGQRYSPDNPDSLMAFMEHGQEISVEYGYDLDEEGTDVEWLDPIGGFLSDWSADNVSATLTAKDVFSVIMGKKYYDGFYQWFSQELPPTTSLYDLAEDVLADAGIEEYDIDESLKNIYIHNPIPVVSHVEALQMIANVAMCALMVRRDGYVQIKATPPIPAISATANNETAYSNVQGILDGTEKEAYANDAKDFTRVDGTMYFVLDTNTQEIRNVGYYSNSVAGDDGEIVGHKLVLGADASVENTSVILSNGVVSNHALSFGWTGDVPVITIVPDNPLTVYGMSIQFRELYATAIVVRIYDENDTLIDELEYENDNLTFVETDTYTEFSKMEIEFPEALSGSRIVIDNIEFDYSGYLVDRSKTNTVPVVKHETKIKTIDVVGIAYKENGLETELYVEDNVVVTVHQGEYFTRTILFNEAVYARSIQVYSTEYPVTSSMFSVEMVKSSAWRVEAKITVLDETAYNTKIGWKIWGFTTTNQSYVMASENLLASYLKGDTVTWSNPLVDSQETAERVATWLADYYASNIEYDVAWRGDPCIEVNDLINVESTINENVLTRLFQNVLNYNGAWSGSFQARKVARNVMDNS